MKSLLALLEYSEATLSLIEGMQDTISDEDFSNRREQVKITLRTTTKAIQDDYELREDMLEALEGIIEIYDPSERKDVHPDIREAFIKCKKAIAKAKGE